LKQMGRPKIDNPKSTQITVKMDKSLADKLDVCVEYYGETRVEVIRKGIESIYSDIKKKHPC